MKLLKLAANFKKRSSTPSHNSFLPLLMSFLIHFFSSLRSFLSLKFLSFLLSSSNFKIEKSSLWAVCTNELFLFALFILSDVKTNFTTKTSHSFHLPADCFAEAKFRLIKFACKTSASSIFAGLNNVEVFKFSFDFLMEPFNRSFPFEKKLNCGIR
jgi:hypothetical protein